MYKNKMLEIELLLDDINEIVNATILYFTDPHYIFDQKELVFGLLSIDERISDIKYLLKLKEK